MYVCTRSSGTLLFKKILAHHYHYLYLGFLLTCLPDDYYIYFLLKQQKTNKQPRNGLKQKNKQQQKISGQKIQ